MKAQPNNVSEAIVILDANLRAVKTDQWDGEDHRINAQCLRLFQDQNLELGELQDETRSLRRDLRKRDDEIGQLQTRLAVAESKLAQCGSDEPEVPGLRTFQPGGAMPDQISGTGSG